MSVYELTVTLKSQHIRTISLSLRTAPQELNRTRKSEKARGRRAAKNDQDLFRSLNVLRRQLNEACCKKIWNKALRRCVPYNQNAYLLHY